MSFNIALSGIQAINEQLTTLSNNIANAGTYGFKSSRANFASVYAGDQANGVQVQSLTQNISQTGSLSSTGRGMDAAIQGRGFFTSRDAQGVVSYSRVGIFSTNADGLLVDSTGKKVQGYGPTVGGVLGTMGDIAIPTGQIPAVATTKVSYAGNMSGDWKVPATAFSPTDGNTYNMVKQSVVYDSLGTQHTVSQYFVKTDADTVTVHYSLDGAAPTANFAMNFGTNGQIIPAATPVLTIAGAATGAADMSFSFDYTGTSKFAGEATNTTNRADGYASGTFVGVELAEGIEVQRFRGGGCCAVETVVDGDAVAGALDEVLRHGVLGAERIVQDRLLDHVVAVRLAGVEGRVGWRRPVGRQVADEIHAGRGLGGDLAGRDLDVAHGAERAVHGRAIALHLAADGVDQVAVVVGCENAHAAVRHRALAVAADEKAAAFDGGVERAACRFDRTVGADILGQRTDRDAVGLLAGVHGGEVGAAAFEAIGARVGDIVRDGFQLLVDGLDTGEGDVEAHVTFLELVGGDRRGLAVETSDGGRVDVADASHLQYDGAGT